MSLRATIQYLDEDSMHCFRTEEFVAPMGGDRLGIFDDDDYHTEPHEIINMASHTFISVRWHDEDDIVTTLREAVNSLFVGLDQ